MENDVVKNLAETLKIVVEVLTGVLAVLSFLVKLLEALDKLFITPPMRWFVKELTFIFKILIAAASLVGPTAVIVWLIVYGFYWFATNNWAIPDPGFIFTNQTAFVQYIAAQALFGSLYPLLWAILFLPRITKWLRSSRSPKSSVEAPKGG